MKKNDCFEWEQRIPILKKLLLIMKLTVFLIAFSAISVWANKSFSQIISLNMEKATLKEVLSKIEDKSGCNFLYSEKFVDVTKTVTINMENKKIEDVLTSLFSGTGIQFERKDRLIILTTNTTSSNSVSLQQKSVSGKVTDSTGAGLPGVSVVVKGTTTGVITDVDGKYSLSNVPANATLQFSFVGMKTQEIAVGNQTSVNIVLADETIGLDDVVVIGYGTVKKSDLTGSVSGIKSDIIRAQPISRIDQALQGRVAGVQITSTTSAPGATSTIRIRGGNSINGDNEPLYVIDGIIGVGDLATINPNDVESIEVLRDASSTAIYGSRGANGVIMVTTKRGKGSKGAQLNYSGYVGAQTVSHKIDMMNGPEIAKFQNDYAVYLNPTAPPKYPDLNNVANTDWFAQSYKNMAMIIDQNLSLTNSNKDGNYLLSMNYFDQDGLMYKNRLKRYQMRFNVDQKIKEIVQIGAALTMSYTNNQNPMLGDISLLPADPIYKPDGTYFTVMPVNGKTFDSPNAKRDLNTNFTNKLRGLGNAYAQLTLFKSLILKTTFGFDLNWQKQNMYLSTYLPSRALLKLGGAATVNAFNYNTFQNENTISYNKTKGVHNFSLLGGFTAQAYYYEDLRTNVQGFQNDVTMYNAMQTGTPSTRIINTDESKWSLLSGLMRINYSYKNRYLLTVSGREDGSSRLGEGKKWSFFPSAAIAWRAYEEDFIKNIKLFSNLKVRASYGVTGSQSIPPYSVADRLSSGSTVMNGAEVIGFYPGSSANKQLSWEKTAQYDVGIEMGFLKNRLTTEFDLYYKKTTDLMLNRELPYQTGFTSILENVGDISNKGIEISLNSINIDTKNFSWKSSVSFSINRNKVLNLAGKDFLENGTGQRLIVGEPVGTFWGSKYLGTWKEGEIPEQFLSKFKPGDIKLEDLDNNGIINTLDFQKIGEAEPDFIGGIGNDLTYKRFTLGLFFDYSVGNDIFDLATSIATGINTNTYGFMRNAWSPTNPTSDIPVGGSLYKYIPDTSGGPGNYSYTVGSSWFLHDGSYLRLRNVNIEYAIPTEKSRVFDRLSAYITATNLFTITNYFGYTPDVNSTGTHATRRGFDQNAYPLARTICIGVRAQF